MQPMASSKSSLISSDISSKLLFKEYIIDLFFKKFDHDPYRHNMITFHGESPLEQLEEHLTE
jgi:hypothetical protein